VKNRVKKIKMMRVGDLKPSASNWRTHPPEQQRAMEAALTELGFAGALVARETEDGELEIIDGHLRFEKLDPNEKVPVVITDFNKDEADKMITVFDPIGALAGVNNEKLGALKEQITFDSHDLQAVLDSIQLDKSEPQKSNEAEGIPGSDQAEIIPEMELQPDEHYDYVIVLATRRQDWNRLTALLNLKKTRKPRTSKVWPGESDRRRKAHRDAGQCRSTGS
jgi:ParB-like chromosome segregation protein Spo0J